MALIAVAVGMGVSITAQERALRKGSARAADRFDLIIAAPGSQTDVLLKTIFLNSGSVELLSPDVVARAYAEPKAEFVAPIAFGDSHNGDPIVGSTGAFALHLSGGTLSEGRVFETHEEAVVGAASPMRIGDTFQPTHGEAHGGAHEDERHHGARLTVVGRMSATGSPWDRAIVVPVELTWELHNLPTGHLDKDHDDEAGATDDHDAEPIGPPFDAATLPGVPALVIKPQSVAAAYGLRNAYRTDTSMAFFPAEVLVELYALLGDVRAVMDIMALATQTLVIAAILVGVMVLLRLYRTQFAVLRALGAPRSFVFLTIWSYVTAIVACGAATGLLIGIGLTNLVSRAFTDASGIALNASLQGPELVAAGAIVLIGAAAATVPAALLYARPVVTDLR
ncbi:ABC transporter permease [Breoghania sp. L-A4]|uniref:FtsX-like permease family protein n=1 Tax=Breoghania sp. L-A4 TaxID=2304600 RepID=UPI000E360B48|nr:ABC transporter permease [Breoghania sp. L-A4]AXS40829.1 ABC transporter permease [Breoghania sp. L-A4]